MELLLVAAPLVELLPALVELLLVAAPLVELLALVELLLVAAPLVELPLVVLLFPPVVLTPLVELVLVMAVLPLVVLSPPPLLLVEWLPAEPPPLELSPELAHATAVTQSTSEEGTFHLDFMPFIASPR